MIARILFTLLTTVIAMSLRAQAPISPFCNFNFDSCYEECNVIMTITSPLGESTIDIGGFTYGYKGGYPHPMGEVYTFILISDDRDITGVPMWYAYVLEFNGQKTYEVHFYGMLTFCGHSLYNIQMLPRPQELQDLTNWCRF